jgi:hypothetical protein
MTIDDALESSLKGGIVLERLTGAVWSSFSVIVEAQPEVIDTTAASPIDKRMNRMVVIGRADNGCWPAGHPARQIFASEYSHLGRNQSEILIEYSMALAR